MPARKPPRRVPRQPAPKKARATTRTPRPEHSPAPRAVRLGAVPGATPGKWIGVWRERMPRHPLELIELPVTTQRTALSEGTVDLALVRLPVGTADARVDDLHVVRLYDEVPVVVCASDSELTAADELDANDLLGQVVIVPADDVLGPLGLHGTVAPSFAAPATTEDAIGTAATGVGVVIVPMSLARLHHRRDVTYRPLRGGPVSTVALAWPRDTGIPELIDEFVGITRGRSARSSRGSIDG